MCAFRIILPELRSVTICDSGLMQVSDSLHSEQNVVPVSLFVCLFVVG